MNADLYEQIQKELENVELPKVDTKKKVVEETEAIAAEADNSYK